MPVPPQTPHSSSVRQATLAGSAKLHAVRSVQLSASSQTPSASASVPVPPHTPQASSWLPQQSQSPAGMPDPPQTPHSSSVQAGARWQRVAEVAGRHIGAVVGVVADAVAVHRSAVHRCHRRRRGRPRAGCRRSRSRRRGRRHRRRRRRRRPRLASARWPDRRSCRPSQSVQLSALSHRPSAVRIRAVSAADAAGVEQVAVKQSQSPAGMPDPPQTPHASSVRQAALAGSA